SSELVEPAKWQAPLAGKARILVPRLRLGTHCRRGSASICGRTTTEKCHTAGGACTASRSREETANEGYTNPQRQLGRAGKRTPSLALRVSASILCSCPDGRVAGSQRLRQNRPPFTILMLVLYSWP